MGEPGHANGAASLQRTLDARFQPVDHRGVKPFRAEHKFRRATPAIRRVVNNNFARLLPVCHQVVNHTRTASKDRTCPFDKPDFAGLGVFLTENEICQDSLPVFGLGECFPLCMGQQVDFRLQLIPPTLGTLPGQSHLFPMLRSFGKLRDFVGRNRIALFNFFDFPTKIQKNSKISSTIELDIYITR